MPDTGPRETLPRGIAAIQGVALILTLAGAIVWFVGKPAPSSGPRLFEVLIIAGALCYAWFAVRCWQWLRSRRRLD